MNASLSEISCSFLPGKIVRNQDVPALYNAAYQCWKKTWGEIFLKAGSPSSLNAENFLRQDIVIALHQENNIIGLLTICFFNLSPDPTYDHAYLQPFPKDLINAYRKEGTGFAATFEYLSVHPEFRRNLVGLSLSEVLIGIGLKISSELHAKVTLATAVRPARVPESGQKFGWCEAGIVAKYGLDCLLLYNKPETACTHPDPGVVSLIEAYWNKRRDLTGLTISKTETQDKKHKDQRRAA